MLINYRQNDGTTSMYVCSVVISPCPVPESTFFLRVGGTVFVDFWVSVECVSK